MCGKERNLKRKTKRTQVFRRAYWFLILLLVFCCGIRFGAESAAAADTGTKVRVGYYAAKDFSGRNE